MITYSNTSHVTINLQTVNRKKALEYHSNTSHVTINRLALVKSCLVILFKYISCYY